MTESPILATLGALLLFLVHVGVIARVILRPHREPASRIAWIVVIITLPVIGIVAYLLLGETNIGRRRVRRMREVLATMPDVADAPGADAANGSAANPGALHPSVSRRAFGQWFRTCGRQSCATCCPDSNASIESMVADIDAATGPRAPDLLYLAAG